VSSDERLAQRAANGDRRAFEAIYKRYHQDLYRFCLAMVGNPQDAQDALQNAMVKVLRALPGEQRKIRLRPWLYRIARNEAVEVLRRRRETQEPAPEHLAAEGVAETVEARERLRRLLADLEELPERQRAVLVMRELSGLGFAQIGDALSTSAAVARQTLYEARLNLRRLEDGREMRCIEVTRELSDADGRVARRRDIRAHLRGCAECRAFHEDIATRRRELAALTPLPLAASAGLLQAILGAGGGTVAAGGTAGGLVGTLGAGGGKGIATSAIFKSAATVAVVGTIGLTAADRGGLVDLTPPGEDRAPSSQGTASPAAAAPDQTRVGRGEAGSSRRSAADAAVPQAAGSPAGGKPFEVGEPTHGEIARTNETETGAPTTGSQAGSAPADADGAPSTSKGQGPPPDKGPSASKGQGPPDAANQGQETAATHKPAHAAQPPGQGGGHGDSAGHGQGGPSVPSPKATPSPAQPEPPAHPAKPASGPGFSPPAADPPRKP
jgi:RNA polymerase sigma factor (sigma-70 family)